MPPPPREGPSGQPHNPYGPSQYGAQSPYGPPPQNPYGQYMSPPPPNLPPPVPPKPQRTKTWVTIAAIVAAVAVAGVVAFLLTNRAERDDAGQVTKEGALTVFDLKGGDCFNNLPADDKEVQSVDAVPCGQPHDAEVLAEVTVKASGAYPGVDKIADEVEQLCVDKVGERLAGSKLSERLDMFFFYPTAESWRQNDRAGTCVAVANDNAKLTEPV
jgi:Septum formation